MAGDAIREELYCHELGKAHLIANILTEMPLEQMLEQIAHAHAVAPILDPTAYIANGARLRAGRGGAPRPPHRAA